MKVRAFLFTLVSALFLLVQQVYFQKQINIYVQQNAELKNKLYLGHIKHLAILRQKDTEIAIEKNNMEERYSTYTNIKSDNYNEGYVSGYHAAIQQFNCPDDIKQ